MLELRHIGFVAADGDANKEILDDVSLTVNEPFVAITGPNGSGKTTLIKLANGLLNPTDGHIMINGLAPGTESKKIVSYLPDRSFFSEHMKVKEIISYYTDFYDTL